MMHTGHRIFALLSTLSAGLCLLACPGSPCRFGAPIEGRWEVQDLTEDTQTACSSDDILVQLEGCCEPDGAYVGISFLPDDPSESFTLSSGYCMSDAHIEEQQIVLGSSFPSQVTPSTGGSCWHQFEVPAALQEVD